MVARQTGGSGVGVVQPKLGSNRPTDRSVV